MPLRRLTDQAIVAVVGDPIGRESNMKHLTVGKRLMTAMLAALCAGVVVAGCGDDDSGAASAGDGGELTTLKVSSTPAIFDAPLRLGDDKGFFEEEGLRLDISPGGNASVMFPALISQSADVGGSSWGALMTATVQGLPLIGVGPGMLGGNTVEDDYCQIVTLDDSEIKSVGDLEGKTVAANQLRSLSEVWIRAAVKKAGKDPDKVKYIEVPFGDMPAALRAGRVDAAGMIEPFLAATKEQAEVNSLASCNGSLMRDLQVNNFVMTKKFVEDNPETVAKFQRALAKSLTFANANPDEVRRIIPTYTDIEPKLVENMIMPKWRDTAPDLPGLQAEADVMFEYGVLPEKLEDASVLATPFPLPGQ